MARPAIPARLANSKPTPFVAGNYRYTAYPVRTTAHYEGGRVVRHSIERVTRAKDAGDEWLIKDAGGRDVALLVKWGGAPDGEPWGLQRIRGGKIAASIYSARTMREALAPLGDYRWMSRTA